MRNIPVTKDNIQDVTFQVCLVSSAEYRDESPAPVADQIQIPGAPVYTKRVDLSHARANNIGKDDSDRLRKIIRTNYASHMEPEAIYLLAAVPAEV